jgi:hypothetical protein
MGWAGKKPRIIQSAHPQRNIIFGPAVAAYQAHVVSKWKGSFPIVVASTGSPRDYGQVVEEHVTAYPNIVGRKQDHGNFDGHHSDPFLAVAFHKMMSCYTTLDLIRVNQLFDEFLKGNITEGHFKRKMRVFFSGKAMMHSGDMWTFIFNSTTNVDLILFEFACYARRPLCLFCDEEVHPICNSCQSHVERTDTAKILNNDDDSKNDLAMFFENRAPCLKLQRPSTTMAAGTGFKILACGDDSIVLSNADLMPPPAYTQALNDDLGFDVKPVLVEVNPYVDKFIFCSSRFYPTSIGWIMAPRLGRAIAKFGWFTQPANYTKELLASYTKADANNRLAMYGWLPFFRLQLKCAVRLTCDAKELKRTDEWSDGWVQNYSHVQPNDETWRMLYHLYGLTPGHEVQYGLLLDGVLTLPCIVNFAPLAEAIRIDCEDGDVDYPDLGGPSDADTTVGF